MKRDCAHPRASHRHGTYLAWAKDGCRCVPCVAASRKHAKVSAYRTATGTHSYVDAGPARAHVKMLLSTLSPSQIEQRSGVHRTAIRVLVGDVHGRPASRRVSRKTEVALLAVTSARVDGEQHGEIDAAVTGQQLRSLMTLGWTVKAVARFAHVDHQVLYGVLQGRRDRVRIANAVKVDRAFTVLRDHPPRGTSRYTSRARNHARAHGWPDPYDVPTLVRAAAQRRAGV